MAYQSFEELVVWKKSSRLAVNVYTELRDSRDFGLKDQMTRAAVSIPSNIAEGHGRKYTKAYINLMSLYSLNAIPKILTVRIIIDPKSLFHQTIAYPTKYIKTPWFGLR